MGTTERRLREKEQRRNAIIAAAEKVFLRKPLETATMDEVAEQAEISKGLLYVYFQSKEDLYHAVILKGLRLIRMSFSRAVKQQNSGIRRARAIGDAYVAFARKHPVYFAGIVYQAGSATPAEEGTYAALCDRERDRIFHIVAEAIELGIKDGSIRQDVDPLQTAIILWGQLHGAIQISALPTVQERYRLTFEELIRFNFRFITDSLRSRRR